MAQGDFHLHIGNYSQVQSEIKAIQSQLDPGELKVAVRQAQVETAEASVEWMRVYPPETIANSPNNPSGHWYERGWGTRWRTGGRRTSEHLGDNWRVTPPGGPNAIGSRLTNIASYARAVQSEQSQAGFHKERGWRTDQGLVAWLKSSGKAVEIFRRAIWRWLGRAA